MQASRQFSPAREDCWDAFLLLGMFVSLATDKVKYRSVHPEGVKGASGKPLVASADAIPLATQKTSVGIVSRCWSVAPIWRDNVQGHGKAAWGRVCGRAKLLAGTLRCLHLCWRCLAYWSPVELLGRCPKPHKGAPPLDPARGNPPLTPPRD